jgi:ATP-dependent DNA ligase
MSPDGAAMHQATADIGAEGTVSKAVRSLYRGGRRSRFWLKTKHCRVYTFQVGGWRPSTSSRPGGLILVENNDPVAVATLALANKERQELIDLLHKYGRQHPTGTVTIPADCLTATVRYTSRTPTHGHLREAFVLAVHPAGQTPISAGAPDAVPDPR